MLLSLVEHCTDGKSLVVQFDLYPKISARAKDKSKLIVSALAEDFADCRVGGRGGIVMNGESVHVCSGGRAGRLKERRGGERERKGGTETAPCVQTSRYKD